MKKMIKSGKFEAVPFKIAIKGTVNNTPLTIEGSGVVPCQGVYEGVLNFSTIPQHFHPSAIATYVMSICCYMHASMRNGGLNINAMGGKGYSTHRVLRFGNDKIVIKGTVMPDANGVTFKGTINGKAKLPSDLSGNSIYIKRIDSTNKGLTLIGKGEGSLFRTNGGEVKVGIETVHNITNKALRNPLKSTQFRIVTESGILNGRSYSARVHSVLDGANTMQKVLEY